MAGYPFETTEWAASLISPIEHIIEVTPADADIQDADGNAVTSRAILVEGTGDLVVVTLGGQTITITDIVAGIWHPMRVRRVNAATSVTGVFIGY